METFAFSATGWCWWLYWHSWTWPQLSKRLIFRKLTVKLQQMLFKGSSTVIFYDQDMYNHLICIFQELIPAGVIFTSQIRQMKQEGMTGSCQDAEAITTRAERSTWAAEDKSRYFWGAGWVPSPKQRSKIEIGSNESPSKDTYRLVLCLPLWESLWHCNYNGTQQKLSIDTD